MRRVLESPLYQLAALLALVAISDWLARHTWLRQLGGALLVIVLAAVCVNIGLLPKHVAGGDGPPPVTQLVYDQIFASLAQVGIFWLLLAVSLREVLRSGWPLLGLFLLGSLGTAVGVVVGMWATGGAETFGNLHHALAGMFVGTYTGGSVNLQAIAVHYELPTGDPALYLGGVAVDNAATTLWMAVTVFLPRLWRRSTPIIATSAADDVAEDTQSVHAIEIATLLAIGLAALCLSRWIASLVHGLPAVVVLTVIALVLAQFPRIQKLAGARVLGMVAVYVFLAVIGSLCDLTAIERIGDLALSLCAFVGITITIHGLFVFVPTKLFGWDPVAAAVASQANIGGATSALALARTLGRPDLTLPAVLLGSVGLALGTFLGFSVAAMLG